MRMLGVCARARRLRDVVSCAELAAFYRRAELPAVAAQVEAVCRSAGEGSGGGLGAAEVSPDAPIGRWLRAFDVEDTRMGWLTGVLLGYPLWTTVARYHTGGFVLKP